MKVTEKQLKIVKESISRIKPAIEAIMKVWPSYQLTMASVLVQNLTFYSPEAHGWDTNEEYDKCKNILNAIDKIAKYSGEQDHTINWIFDTISMDWDGFWLSEMLEQ